jgi:hypothetical protein
MEWRAAREAFAAFGAVRWAELAQQRLTGGPPTPTSSRSRGVTTATFRCDGDTRTICFGELTLHMRDLKGFRYLERLLADPGREFHVLDLVAVERGSLPTGRTGHQGLDAVAEGIDAGLPLIEEAARLNDEGRVELAQRDRDYLLAELARAVGLRGRHRSVGGTTERARTSVTRSLRYALGRLARPHPTLAAHLEQSVHTGTYCSYTPDPIVPIVWHL